MINFEFYKIGLTKYYMIFYTQTNIKFVVKLGTSPNFFLSYTIIFVH